MVLRMAIYINTFEGSP